MSGARPRSPTRAQANALGGVALVLWTALAWLSKETAEVPVFLKMAVAFGIAGLPLAHRILIRGQAWPHAPFAFWALSLGGLFGYHLLFFLAVEHAGGGIAEVNLVNYLWPLLIVLLARRATGGGSARLAVLAGVSGFVGTAFLVCDPTIFARLGESLVGLGLAAGGAAVWALYSVGIARFGRAPLASIGAACALTAGLALAMHLACEGFASGTWLLAAGPRQWACLLLLGIGPAGGAFYLWHLAMLHGDARSLGLAAYGVPLGSTVLLVATGYAEWGWHLIAGGTLIVAPALCVTLRARRLPEQEAGAAPQARW